MDFIVFFLAGALAAASGLLIGYFGYLRLLRSQQRRVRGWNARLKAESAALERWTNALADKERQTEESIAARLEQQANEIENRQRALDEYIQKGRIQAEESLSACERDIEQRKHACDEDLKVRTRQVNDRQQQLREAIAAFEARKIKYDDIVRENGGLKADCFNLSVQLKKMERDHASPRPTAGRNQREGQCVGVALPKGERFVGR